MNNTNKKIFLAISIVVPFLLYCGYYYGVMIKNAPYKFSEFESLRLNYGIGDSLINRYDSKTGNYQYLNSRDSLIKTRVKLSKDDLLYLHRKAAQIGFWNFPEVIAGTDTALSKQSPHYYLEYRYKHKVKKLLFDESYTSDVKLLGAAKALIDVVNKSINDAEDRTNKALHK